MLFTRDEVIDAINQLGVYEALSEISAFEIEDDELKEMWEMAEEGIEGLLSYLEPELEDIPEEFLDEGDF